MKTEHTVKITGTLPNLNDDYNSEVYGPFRIYEIDYENAKITICTVNIKSRTNIYYISFDNWVKNVDRHKRVE